MRKVRHELDLDREKPASVRKRSWSQQHAHQVSPIGCSDFAEDIVKDSRFNEEPKGMRSPRGFVLPGSVISHLNNNDGGGDRDSYELGREAKA